MPSRSPLILLLLSLPDTAALDCLYSASYPRQYVTYALQPGETIEVDGRLDDPAWDAVGFTEEFVDISTKIKPRLSTRAKIRWDDRYLYIGAVIEEPQAFANISSTCHCNEGPGSKKDQVVYHDNDFEIFVDADGTTHYYKEFEMNAANATWDLCLNKPYMDNGYENSTRVFGTRGFDDLRPWGGPEGGFCAAFVEGGKLNRPDEGPTKFWSVEVAMSLKKLIYNTTAEAPPKPGDFWRINFSRVEWAVKQVGNRYLKEPSCQSCPVPGSPVEDNWVWSPQGVVDMHRPERWAFLQFSNSSVNRTEPLRNPQWTVRSVAAAIYYAEHAYFNDPDLGNKKFTSSLEELKKARSQPPVPIPHALDGLCSKPPVIEIGKDGKTFLATVTSNDGCLTATIRNDRLLKVTKV